MLKSEFTVVLIAVLLGLVAGVSRYWEDISEMAFPSVEPATWTLGEIDQKVLDKSADIDRIMALVAPEPGASEAQWQRFWSEIKTIDSGQRSSYPLLSPLLPWYVYVAKHNPQFIYDGLNKESIYSSLVDHFIQNGLLSDWFDHIEDVDTLLLTSREATLSYAFAKGDKETRAAVKNAFFSSAESDGKTISIDLEILRYAMIGMTASERVNALKALKSSRFKYDPRAVQRLALLGEMDENELIALIRHRAYPQKSMSSYMTTAALLGDIDYAKSLLVDVKDNAKQPTNFYCAACAIALATDGLVGRQLYSALGEDKAQIVKTESGFVIRDGRVAK